MTRKHSEPQFSTLTRGNATGQRSDAPRCSDWPNGQDLLKQAWLEGHLANGEAVNLFAEECAEGTLVICWVKRTSRSSPGVNLPFRTEVVAVPLTTSLKGSS